MQEGKSCLQGSEPSVTGGMREKGIIAHEGGGKG